MTTTMQILFASIVCSVAAFVISFYVAQRNIRVRAERRRKELEFLSQSLGMAQNLRPPGGPAGVTRKDGGYECIVPTCHTIIYSGPFCDGHGPEDA